MLLSQLRDISLEGCRLMSSPSKEPLRIEGNKIIYSDDPLVYVIENYLTDKECQHLIDLSKNNFKPAKTLSNADHGNTSVRNEKTRTGRNCWIKHTTSKTCKGIGSRIAKLIDWKLRCAEKIQVVYYSDGTQYKEHYDCFETDTRAGKIEIEHAGQRMFTALGYLNNVEEGGATEFPLLNISVKPKQGSLLVWQNVIAGTNEVHKGTLHAGRPVTKGEKFAFNLWFREKQCR